MKVDFEDFRSIEILIDPQKNIVIFPRSKTDFPFELADGTIVDFTYLPAYYPIEVNYPYDAVQLAEKIKYGIEQWNQHSAYSYEHHKKVTSEEKYYGVKGFKNATKGVRHIDLGWDNIQGKYVTLSLPLKRGYAYIRIDSVKLSDDADWLDFANQVLEYVEIDVTQLKRFKTFKRSINF